MTSINDKDSVNCETAELIGLNILRKLDGKTFSEISFKKKDCDTTLLHLQKGITLDNKKLHFNSSVLFSRLVALRERENDIKSCFQYELAAEPTSLFKDRMMHKCNKSDLINIITKNTKTLKELPTK